MSEEQGGRAADGVGTESRSILSSSAVMAAGTAVSRLSGYVRTALLVAALAAGVRADVFAIANMIPNMLYILLAGGVFNAVLVPQLVRALKNDEDGGTAYTNRLVTLAALFLGSVTVLLVLAAPWVMDVFLAESYDSPALAEQKASAVAFARYCLPQVFFYGMFVLVGQVLNARGSFGPMMWAPIANNVIAVGVLVAYLVVWGRVGDAEADAAFTTAQELLLGLGSTLGIVVQFLILLPVLRRTGFVYRPRFDFRDAGLGHTLRLGLWTALFVVVNQVAYVVVVKLASRGPTQSDDGTGYTVYSGAQLISMVPHAIVTVSLATAMLPRLSAYAADGDLHRLGRSVASTLRTALVVVLPFAALLPVVAPDVANVAFGFSSAEGTVASFVPSLRLFGIGLLLFTVHYFMLRGFYALEQTRTVFLIQCGVAATNIVAGVLLVRATSAAHTSPALVVAYALAYLTGSALSYAVLRRTVGGLDTPRTVRFLVRLGLAVAVATGVAWLVWWSLSGPAGLGEQPSIPASLGRGALVGLVDLAVLVLVARALHIAEVSELVDPVVDTIRRRRRGRSSRRTMSP